VVVPLLLGLAALEVDPLVTLAIGVRVALLLLQLAATVELHPGINLAVEAGVLLGGGRLAVGVLDELVVLAVLVGVGLLRLHLLVVIEVEDGRCALCEGRTREKKTKAGEKGAGVR